MEALKEKSGDLQNLQALFSEDHERLYQITRQSSFLRYFILDQKRMCCQKAPDTKGYKNKLMFCWHSIVHVTKRWPVRFEMANVTFPTHDKPNLEKRQAAHIATSSQSFLIKRRLIMNANVPPCYLLIGFGNHSVPRAPPYEHGHTNQSLDFSSYPAIVCNMIPPSFDLNAACSSEVHWEKMEVLFLIRGPTMGTFRAIID